MFKKELIQTIAYSCVPEGQRLVHDASGHMEVRSTNADLFAAKHHFETSFEKVLRHIGQRVRITREHVALIEADIIRLFDEEFSLDETDIDPRFRMTDEMRTSMLEDKEAMINCIYQIMSRLDQ